VTRDGTTLTLQRFEALLELHGSALERWPARDRDAASTLLASNDVARALLDEAQRLDAALASLPAAEPSAALRRAVAEIPLRHPQPPRALFGMTPAWFPFRSFGRALAVALLAISLGALLGLYGADVEQAQVAQNQADAEQRVDEWGDLTELAFADDLDRELAP